LESQWEGKKEDDDEGLFKNFQPKIGVAAVVDNLKRKLFLSKNTRKFMA